MIIIGIDPGTAATGFGIIEILEPSRKSGRKELKSSQTRLKWLDHGVIKTRSDLSDAERLKKLEKELNLKLREYRADVLAVERLYFFKNVKTAFPVAQARGVILLTAAKKNIPVFEFTPLQVKMVITGYGRAYKSQVQKMIKLLLGLDKIPKPDDAADALGVAICCARTLDNQ